MEDFRKRDRYKKSFYSKALIILLAFFLVILVKSTLRVFTKNNEAQKNLDDTEVNLVSLEEREANLEGEIQKLSTERGIDEEIRTKFRVAKEGEEMVVLINSPEPTTTKKEGAEESIWSKIWPF